MPGDALGIREHRSVGRLSELPRDRRHVRDLGHPAHEEERRQDDADLHGDREIDDHGQEKRREENEDVASRRAAKERHSLMW